MCHLQPTVQPLLDYAGAHAGSRVLPGLCPHNLRRSPAQVWRLIHDRGSERLRRLQATAKNGWQTIPFPSGEVSLRPSENMGFNSLTREQIWFKQPGREIFLSWKILIRLPFPKDRVASPTGLSEDPFLRLFVLPAYTGVALFCMNGGDSPPAPPHPGLREGGEKMECEQLSSCVFYCFVFAWYRHDPHVAHHCSYPIH